MDHFTDGSCQVYPGVGPDVRLCWVPIAPGREVIYRAERVASRAVDEADSIDHQPCG